MYLEYFGLKRHPFRITPDTELFFPGGGRGEILGALAYAITSGEGIVKVVGEVGSGKTMLCRMLVERLPATVGIVYLANPRLSPAEVPHAIAFELKLPVSPGSERFVVMQQIHEYLLAQHSAGRSTVVFVEEAQGMPLETLEEIRLLSNLETRRHKLLQTVLFGQPELNERLQHHSVRQLRQRISFQYELRGLDRDELDRYLHHRLSIASYSGEPLFGRAVVSKLHRITGGTPRLVNIVAHKALMLAYGEGKPRVSARHIRDAAADTPEVRRDWLPWALALTVATVVVSLGIGWFLLR